MRPYAPCSSPTGKKGTMSPHSCKSLRFLPTVLPRSHLPVNQSLWWWWWGANTGDEVSQDQLSDLGLKPVPQNHMGEDDKGGVVSQGKFRALLPGGRGKWTLGGQQQVCSNQLFSVFLAGLNVIINVKHVTACLAQRRCPVSMRA